VPEPGTSKAVRYYAFTGSPAARILQQEAAHDLRGDRRELRAVLTDQAQVSFVNQGCRLQGAIYSFLPQEVAARRRSSL
jgi:hypothetical protein